MPALKLRAVDNDDIAVISTILQDALVAVGEMIYLPEEERFVLVANRFCWEMPPGGEARASLERTMTGLCVDRVTSVQRRGFSPRDEDRILSLLAIRPDSLETPTALILDFADGISVRLEVERVMCHLDDLGEPWPTRWQPKHPVAESD
jgi:hypothetical protein